MSPCFMSWQNKIQSKFSRLFRRIESNALLAKKLKAPKNPAKLRHFSQIHFLFAPPVCDWKKGKQWWVLHHHHVAHLVESRVLRADRNVSLRNNKVCGCARSPQVTSCGLSTYQHTHTHTFTAELCHKLSQNSFEKRPFLVPSRATPRKRHEVEF